MRDAGLGHLVARLLALGHHVVVLALLVGHLLLLLGVHALGHAVAGVHLLWLLGHTRLLLGEMLRGWLVGGLDRTLIVDAVLAISGWFGSVQTRLGLVSRRFQTKVERALAWIRFLPSALVTRGWSLGVVNV